MFILFRLLRAHLGRLTQKSFINDKQIENILNPGTPPRLSWSQISYAFKLYTVSFDVNENLPKSSHLTPLTLHGVKQVVSDVENLVKPN